MVLYRKKKQPIYSAIRDSIRAQITQGIWPVGHQLPTEDQLQAEFGVSRGTLRQAMAELEAEGYITRMAGRGTFVSRVTPQLEKTLGEIKSFGEQLADAGIEATTEILFAGRIKISEAQGSRVTEAFGLPYDAEVVCIKRLRKGNLLPFALQTVYLVPDSCPGILEEDLSQLTRLYRAKYGRLLTQADEILHVSVATPQDALVLQTTVGSPLVIRDRVSFDQNEEAFEVLHSVDLGERFSYRYLVYTDRTSVVSPRVRVSA